jgi:hypothetical protein
VSRGPIGRFEDDDRRLCIELWVDRDPALPQTIAFLPEGRARAQRIGQLGLDPARPLPGTTY